MKEFRLCALVEKVFMRCQNALCRHGHCATGIRISEKSEWLSENVTEIELESPVRETSR